MNDTLPKKYFYELNFIRAIACMCVVMVHVTARHYHINGQIFNWATLFLNQITRFGTPVFAVLSGFLLYNQVINRGFNLKKFISSRFSKVVIPFIIWSFIYLIIKSYKFPWIEGGFTPEEFTKYFLLGDSYYHLYFILVIIQFYLLFPILQFARSKNSMIALTVITLFINFYFMKPPLELENELISTFIRDRSSIFFWIYYFLLGCLLVHYWQGIND